MAKALLNNLGACGFRGSRSFSCGNTLMVVGVEIGLGAFYLVNKLCGQTCG